MFKTSLLLLEEAALWGGGRVKVAGLGRCLVPSFRGEMLVALVGVAAVGMQLL